MTKILGAHINLRSLAKGGGQIFEGEKLTAFAATRSYRDNHSLYILIFDIMIWAL